VKALAIFIGIKGSVIAIDRATGQSLWETPLKGSDFVNVILDEDRVLAATKGELFCLDAVTGKLLWNNKLPGLGQGIITIATSSGSTAMGPLRKRQQDQEDAASAATTAVIVSG
jgi:outer membrane protein assembly factor BamB